jgi:uncharacterized protein YecT (DUF1311 family)
MYPSKSWIFFMIVALSGCSVLKGGTAVDCGSPDSRDVTLSIARDQITKLTGTTEGGEPGLSKSKIRAAVQQLVLTLEDIRTTKKDPNSTKRFCTGTLKLVVPAEMIRDAETARELANESTLSDLADASNVDASANAFKSELTFNVQPTDEGDKVFSEIEGGDPTFSFFSELLKDTLLKNQVVEAKATADRMAAEKAAAEQSAATEQRAAALNEAQTENKLAVQTINAVWRSIPSETRQQLLAMQLAWGRKKDADCRVEASSSSTNEDELNENRLRCDTRIQNERASYLKQYLPSGAPESEDGNINVN